MGGVQRRIDQAYYHLMSEVRHHVKLSQVKNSDYENGFAQGLTEALRIVAEARNGSKDPSEGVMGSHNSVE